jgi:hypothetical protein
MFELSEKLNRLDIPASKVLRLHRSLGDVQIALPGQHSQMATAYICAFSVGKGARVVIGLHLKDDFKVIYYLNAGGEISSANAGSVLNQAIDFSETLGFMMNDVDIHKLGAEEKSSLWETMPLKNPPLKPKPPAVPQSATKSAPVATSAEIVEETEELSAAESVELDLGLPRRKLVASSKKQRPSPVELEKKRGRLRENLGRFLSSL